MQTSQSSSKIEFSILSSQLKETEPIVAYCPVHGKRTLLDKFSPDGKMLCRKCDPEAWQASDTYIEEMIDKVRDKLDELIMSVEDLSTLYKEKLDEQDDPVISRIIEITYEKLP